MKTIPFEEKIKRAKEWGTAHGYYGMIGGWIGHKDRLKAICQGWERLYNLCAVQIEHWRTHREGFSSGDPVWYYTSGYYKNAGHRARAHVVGFTPARARIKIDAGQVDGGKIKVVRFSSLQLRPEGAA